MRGISFCKSHGAGNDFVILDCRRQTVSPPTPGQVRAMLDRRRGIGADGLMMLSPCRLKNAVAVRYWNADGSSAPFCGNGARCAADLILGRSPASEVFLIFGRRTYQARRAGAGRIRLALPSPRLLAIPEPPPPGAGDFWSAGDSGRTGAHGGVAEPDGESLAAAWIDSGVPHFILPVSDLEAADLGAVAPPIRCWHALGSGGTNVDLIEEVGGEWRVRTWERGIEDETPACGSGLAAAGFYAAFLLGRPVPIMLRSAGGDSFVLHADPDGERMWLEGPAALVYTGRLQHGYPVARRRAGR